VKILVCLNKDIESNIALNLLLDELKHHEVVINTSKGVGHKDDNIEELQIAETEFPFKILFPELNRLFPEVREGKFLTYEQISKKCNFQLYSINKINSEDDGVKLLKEIKPDLIISIRYGQIFHDKVISIPKYGILNLHSGKLPDYRGVLATFRATSNNDKKLGTTLHYINDSTVDSGDIVDIFYINNDKNRSLLDNIIKLYYGGAELIKVAIREIQKTGKKLECKHQDVSKGHYFKYPTKDEVAQFKANGHKIIDIVEYKKILDLYL
jgi:methionyl-tRNA formyltransferase